MKQYDCLRNSTTFVTVLEYIGGHREQNYEKVIFVVIFQTSCGYQKQSDGSNNCLSRWLPIAGL